jgi:hypothetical protein
MINELYEFLMVLYMFAWKNAYRISENSYEIDASVQIEESKHASSDIHRWSCGQYGVIVDVYGSLLTPTRRTRVVDIILLSMIYFRNVNMERLKMGNMHLNGKLEHNSTWIKLVYREIFQFN